MNRGKLLWHQQCLVQMHTRVMNQLWAVAPKKGLRRKKGVCSPLRLGPNREIAISLKTPKQRRRKSAKLCKRPDFDSYAGFFSHDVQRQEMIDTLLTVHASGRGERGVAAEWREHLGTLPRRLGIGASAVLIVGFITGSGIFRSPSRVALEAGSARMALLAETIDAKGVFNILRDW
jgi:hypothetical protein